MAYSQPLFEAKNGLALHAPSSGRARGAHLGLFGGKKKSPQNKNFDNHHSEINHRDDGNVLVAQELSDALLAKIRWGILTP